MDLGLHGRSVLITAASKGIGRGIAVEFAREGARVAISARGKEGLAEAETELAGIGGDVLAVSADATKPDDVRRLVNETVRHFGTIDVLVNNAGDAWLGHSVDTTDAQWEESINVNLLSAVRFTQEVVPHMRKNGGGRIINIASVSGHTMLPALADYQAAK